MPTANINLLTLANTFLLQMQTINNLTNSANELRNGNYSKDNGNFIVANGIVQILQTTGTVLQVGGGVSVGGTLTTNNFIDSGNFSVLGNVAIFSNPNVVVNIANTFITKNAIINNLIVSGNVVVQGTQSVNTPYIVINSNTIVATNGAIIVYRGANTTNAGIYWNEVTQTWQVTTNVINNTVSTILTTANLASFNPTLTAYNESVVYATVTGAYTANLANGNVFDLTLASPTGTSAITFTKAATTGKFDPVTLILRQSAATFNAVTFANTVKWTGGQQPNLTPGSGNVDVITIGTDDGGVTYLGGSSGSGGGGATSNSINVASNTVLIRQNTNIFQGTELNFINTSSVTITSLANGNYTDLMFNSSANVASNISVAYANQANFIMAVGPANGDANLVFVIRNGLVQAPNMYTVSGNVVTLATPALANEIVETRVLGVTGVTGTNATYGVTTITAANSSNLKITTNGSQVIIDTNTAPVTGGGTSKVLITNYPLGGQSGGQSTLTFYVVPNVAHRGMVSAIQVTTNIASSCVATNFNFAVTGNNQTGKTIYNIENNQDGLPGLLYGGSYPAGTPTYTTVDPSIWYYESNVPGDENLYIGIQNDGIADAFYTLAFLRIEKFA